MLRLWREPHIRVMAAAWLNRIVAAALGFLNVRLLTTSLGGDTYATFAVLSGSVGWFVLADGGIGLSLQNHVSERRAMGEGYQDLALTAFVMSLGVLLALTGMFLCEADFLAPRLLGSLATPEQQYRRAFVLLGVVCIATNATSIGLKLWYAEQRGYLSQLLPMAASVVTSAGFATLGCLESERRLVGAVLWQFVPNALLAMISAGWLLRRSLRAGGVPRISIANMIMRRAGGFWLLALGNAAVMYVDYFVLARYASSREIVEYNLAMKLAAPAYVLYSGLLTAVWPTFAELGAKGEWPEMKARLRKYTAAGSGGMLVMSCLLVLLAPWVVKLVAPTTDISLGVPLLLGIGILQTVRVWCETHAMALQSISSLKVFWITVPLQALIGISGQLTLAPVLGGLGVVIAISIASMTTMGWMGPLSLGRRAVGEGLHARG